MYTLRTFKDAAGQGSLHINLGNSYEVRGVSDEDKELGINLRIFSEEKHIPQDGLAIWKDDYAYIMTDNGSTFDVLNRPKNNY